tara:strand:- start:263 stop:472 length:210 start_codon:yes stop_codon:yes gene_type:complete
MPIWLRNLTFNKIQKFYKEQNEASKGDSEKSWVDPAVKKRVKEDNKKYTAPKFVKNKATPTPQPKTSYK